MGCGSYRSSLQRLDPDQMTFVIKKLLENERVFFFSLGLSQKNYGNTYEIVLRFLCKIKIKIPKLEKIKIYIPILDSGACATLLSHLSLVIF